MRYEIIDVDYPERPIYFGLLPKLERKIIGPPLGKRVLSVTLVAEGVHMDAKIIIYVAKEKK